MGEFATFVHRDLCLGCSSASIAMLSSGSFDEDPLHSFIANDPWGENPLPYLKNARWEYVICKECALTYHRKVLSPEWAERKFSKWISAEAIAEFERKLPPGSKFERGLHFTERAIQIEKLTRGRGSIRVLDFGCGNGEFVEQCRLYGLEAVGVDRSTARIEKNRGTIYPDLGALYGEQFHAITLFEVLEHLEEPRPVLEALLPHLCPGGILVLETPDASGVTGIQSFHDYQMIHPLDHINGFTPKTLRSFAERLGFRAIAPPTGHATAEIKRVVKTELKRVLSFAVPRKTQLYFVKT
jgi:SAM-dependent methyltransferase